MNLEDRTWPSLQGWSINIISHSPERERERTGEKKREKKGRKYLILYVLAHNAQRGDLHHSQQPKCLFDIVLFLALSITLKMKTISCLEGDRSCDRRWVALTFSKNKGCPIRTVVYASYFAQVSGQYCMYSFQYYPIILFTRPKKHECFDKHVNPVEENVNAYS